MIPKKKIAWLYMLSVCRLQKSANILKSRIMHKIGEKSGEGHYKCTKCRDAIYLNDASDV